MDVKQSATYQQQMDLLRQKGFLISDEQDCLNKLSQIRYYRLRAYLLPFRKEDGSYFRDIDIHRIFSIYEFDSRLRAILFACIEKIEIFFRSAISYYHAQQYGALGYLDGDHYNPKHDHEKFLGEFDRAVRQNRKSLIVKWHEDQYDGHYPIWVAVELFTFGMLSRFYQDMKRADQKAIAREIGITDTELRSWLQCLTDMRNRCAHYSRLYYWKFPFVPKNIEIPANRDTRVFDMVYIMMRLYPDQEKWNHQVLEDLKSLIDDFFPEAIKLNHIGFPDNWESILRKC